MNGIKSYEAPKRCEKTIWVGKFKDVYGPFEILVPACNKDEAIYKIKSSIKEIKTGKKGFVGPGITNEDMIYVEEVGNFDYIRE